MNVRGIRMADLPSCVRAKIEQQATGAETSGEQPLSRTVLVGPRTMNKTEALYAEHLERLRLAEVVLDYHFEAFKLRLADRTFYTPDFLVIRPEAPFLQFHEVKGFMRDDAAVKLKVAARLYPKFRFILARAAKGGGWKTQEVRSWPKPKGSGRRSSG